MCNHNDEQKNILMSKSYLKCLITIHSRIPNDTAANARRSPVPGRCCRQRPGTGPFLSLKAMLAGYFNTYTKNLLVSNSQRKSQLEKLNAIATFTYTPVKLSINV